MIGQGVLSKREEPQPHSAGINLSNQNRGSQKLISMRSKSPILSAIDNEMENLLNTRPFGNEED